MPAADQNAKWEAFKLVKCDHVEELRRCLANHPVDEWRHWRNFGGKTLLELAEWESTRDSGGNSDCLCYLRERLSGELRGTRQGPPDEPPLGVRVTMQPVIPDRHTFVAPIAAEPVVIREPVREPIREPIVVRDPVAAREPIVREPIVQAPIREPIREPAVVVPVVAEPVLEVQKVVRPNVVERVVEVPQVQEHVVPVDVPEKHFHLVTKEVPRMTINEESYVRTVPVHHVEEVLNVTVEPQVTVRQEPRITVREEIEVVPVHIQKEAEEFVAEPMEPPTVETIKTVIKPEMRLVPHYMKVEPDVSHREETITKDYTQTVQREEVILKEELEKVEIQKTIPQREERIVEFDQMEVRKRMVEVPEVTTVRKVNYVPTYEMETNWREPVTCREPLTFSQIDRNGDGVITREELRAALSEGVEEHLEVMSEQMAEEMRRLRVENLRLQQEGTTMEAELKRYQLEADALVKELSKERRLRHELAVKLRVEPEVRRTMLSPQARGRVSPPPRSTSPQVRVGRTVRGAMSEWMRDAQS